MKPAVRWIAGLLGALALGAAGAQAATTPVTAAAQAWVVEPATSRLTFKPRLAGGDFEGRFDHFDATVRFDPRDLPHSSLLVTVDLLSARTGDTDRDGSLQGPDFFQTKRWPQARFTAHQIRALGGNRYQASGQLTLRDVTSDISLPFTFELPAATGKPARMSGTTTVQRLAFGVGQGDWRSTEWLADAVRVDFALTLVHAR